MLSFTEVAASSPIALTALSNATHAVVVKMYAADGTTLITSSTVNFTIAVPTISTIADARAATVPSAVVI